MAKQITPLASLIITSGQNVSGFLDLRTDLANANIEGLAIFAPATLTNASLKVQASTDSISWKDLQSGGADITLAAGKAITLTQLSIPYLRLSGASNEAATRTIELSKLEEISKRT